MAVFRRGKGKTYYGYLILGRGQRQRLALAQTEAASELLLRRLQDEASRGQGPTRRPGQDDSLARVWPGHWNEKAAMMLRRDLEEANIPYADELGSVFDFHGLRGQFITSLARAGVHPRTAQELARHSDINLTMGHYTRLHDAELARAVEELPGPQKNLKKNPRNA